MAWYVVKHTDNFTLLSTGYSEGCTLQLSCQIPGSSLETTHKHFIPCTFRPLKQPITALPLVIFVH